MVAALKFWARLCLAIFLLTAAGAARAADHMSLRLLSDGPSVTPGGQIWLGIEERPDAGWHTYWRNPGDTGEAPQADWTLPKGALAGDLQYPAPQRLAYPGVVTYGYDHPVVLLTRLTAPATARPGDRLPIAVHVSTLVCADVCEPAEADLKTSLTIGAARPGPLSDAVSRLPQAVPVAVSVEKSRDIVLRLKPAIANPAAFRSAYLFPENASLWPPATAQTVTAEEQGVTVRLTGWSAWPSAPGQAVLAAADGTAYRFALDAGPPAPAWGLWSALVLAFIGGLILNLMPCVFPILSMKLLAITRSGHDRDLARVESVAYLAGAVVSFVILAAVLEAARALGQAVGWGFQLQSPVVTAILSAVLFLVGLNLSGLFEVGGSLQAAAGNLMPAGSKMPDVVSAALTGVLAVVVAAPCTAPFMATAIGFALTQGGWASLSVFVALGTGFALPFVALTWLLTALPGMARFMPRPGRWMSRLRAVLAIPMYLAAVWMVWVFARQAGIGFTALLVAGLGAVAMILIMPRLTPPWRSLMLGAALIVACTGLATALVGGRPPAAASEPIHGEAFSVARLDALRTAGKPVLVDLTAAWCVTCKVNEQMVLRTDVVKAALSKSGTAYLVGDWTRQDAAITRYLAGFRRSGVPLYVYYAPGAEPKILPQILTVDAVVSAVGAK